MRESKLENMMRLAVEDRGGLFWKLESPGTAGVPDRLLMPGDGRTLYVELKAPGRKLRPLQVYRKRQLEQAGCTVYVVDSVERMVQVVKEVFGA